MMTDRELLELAAKAAGIEGAWGKEGYIEGHEGFIPAGWRRAWNPLTNSGDALDLAVKLRMTVRQFDRDSVSAGWPAGQDGAPTLDGVGPWCWQEWLADHGGRRDAATRRAIVRAAAALAEARTE